MSFLPVREARCMWERTAPQLTLDVDALEDREGAEGRTPRATLTSGQNPSRSSSASHKIGAGTTPPAVPGITQLGKGTDTSCRRGPASEGRPAPNTNNEGDRRTTIPGSAAVASQETS